MPRVKFNSNAVLALLNVQTEMAIDEIILALNQYEFDYDFDDDITSEIEKDVRKYAESIKVT
jgi:hypothetical protein